MIIGATIWDVSVYPKFCNWWRMTTWRWPIYESSMHFKKFVRKTKRRYFSYHVVEVVVFERIYRVKTLKKVQDLLKKTYKRVKKVKKVWLLTQWGDIENSKMEEDDTITKYFGRLITPPNKYNYREIISYIQKLSQRFWGWCFQIWHSLDQLKKFKSSKV